LGYHPSGERIRQYPVNIPAISWFSGMETQKTAERMLKQTGVEGVTISPWEPMDNLSNRKETGEHMPEPGIREKIDVCKLHLELLINIKNEAWQS
jgi:tRNA-dihydrouridine synthase